MIPPVLSHYRIVQKLGEGGMGEVYLADDLVLGRRVALKVLPARLLDDANAIARFEREARTVSALNHPNILTIHELGLEGGIRFIATEYVEGSTLRARMNVPVALRDALDIAAGIATGLAAAHRAGIVHRDLKPENVMIRTDGVVKLLDFGIAAFTEHVTAVSNVTPTTDHEVFAGTLPYMSPEQLRGQRTDARTDIYSFGVVLFEMLAGRPPFNARLSADLVAAILTQEPPDLARQVAGIPADLDRLVASALAKAPAARPAAIADALSAIARVRQSLDRETRFATLPARSREAGAGTNLPAELTPLVGRAAEIDGLTHLLRDGATRLVTVTGAGGIGKTRLALAAAHRLRDDFADGVFLVALGALSDPALVATTIARSLGVEETPHEETAGALERHLAGRELLLVLDNFEQLMDSANVITELLTSAPLLKVLITSQAILRVRGEREFPLAPLPVPAARESADVLAANPAVALLVARAKDLNPAFELTPENAAALVEICRRLEGLPLAIELAAPRLKILSPAAVLAKLDEPLTFLTGGARDLPQRQKTMLSAIEWSYSHLTDAEKTLFRRLAVFNGGCASEAVRRICSLGAPSGEDTLELFTSIVDKSLVRRAGDPAVEPRFTMLETIRSFAASLFAQSGEATELRNRHAAYFAELAEKIEPELHSASGARWLASLDVELHNIRSALNWCADTGQTRLGLRLGASLLPFWLRRGHVAEGRRHLARALDADPDSDDPSRVKALYAAGVLAEAQGEFPDARRYFDLNLDVQRRRGDLWGIASALNNLGIIALRLKDYPAARRLYDESWQLWQRLGNRPAIGLVLQNLGNIARIERRFDDARAFYQDSLAEFRAMSDDLGVAKCFGLLSELAREEGRLEVARTLGEESLTILMRLTEHREVALCLADLGRIERESGNPGDAQSLYQESLVIFRELGDALGAARMLEALAALAAAGNRPDDAIRMAATAGSLRNAAGAPLSGDERVQFDAWLHPARNALGPARAAQLWREGEAWSLDEAVAFAERRA